MVAPRGGPCTGVWVVVEVDVGVRAGSEVGADIWVGVEVEVGVGVGVEVGVLVRVGVGVFVMGIAPPRLIS